MCKVLFRTAADRGGSGVGGRAGQWADRARGQIGAVGRVGQWADRRQWAERASGQSGPVGGGAASSLFAVRSTFLSLKMLICGVYKFLTIYLQ